MIFYKPFDIHRLRILCLKHSVRIWFPWILFSCLIACNGGEINASSVETESIHISSASSQFRSSTVGSDKVNSTDGKLAINEFITINTTDTARQLWSNYYWFRFSICLRSITTGFIRMYFTLIFIAKSCFLP